MARLARWLCDMKPQVHTHTHTHMLYMMLDGLMLINHALPKYVLIEWAYEKVSFLMLLIILDNLLILGSYTLMCVWSSESEDSY